MGATIKNLIYNFKSKDSLFRLIVINVVIFLVIAIINVFCKLFAITIGSFDTWIAVPSSMRKAILHFWTIVTYMFVHYDFFHILFNMLVLYWFGKIFLMYFTQKNLVALYLLGGIAGGLFFILIFNTIPFFISQGTSYLIGASASVSAIIFGIALYKKDLKVNLLLIGPVKITNIALAIFVIDFISLGSNNAGGHVAHIGGSLIGLIFAWRLSNGHDITRPINNIIDFVFNLFKRQPKMKIKYQKKETDYQYNKRKNEESQDIDSILDKIKQSGYKSLTDDERKRLFDASNK